MTRRFPLQDVRVPERHPHLDAQSIIERYGGFDGSPWPLDEDTDALDLQNGLIPLAEYARAKDYYEEASGRTKCGFLYLDRREHPLTGPELPRHIIPGEFVFRGYDYGVYASEYSCYSVILNEILLGDYPELTSLSSQLNEWLLLPTPSIGGHIPEIRQALLAKGADLETGCEEEFSVIGVYGLRKR